MVPPLEGDKQHFPRLQKAFVHGGPSVVWKFVEIWFEWVHLSGVGKHGFTVRVEIAGVFGGEQQQAFSAVNLPARSH